MPSIVALIVFARISSETSARTALSRISFIGLWLAAGCAESADVQFIINDDVTMCVV